MLSEPDKPPVPADPSPSGPNGKRRLVEEILRTFKKNKSDKDSRTWEWADRDLHASCGLKEGDKIYVKYEYEDILVLEPDSSATPIKDNQPLSSNKSEGNGVEVAEREEEVVDDKDNHAINMGVDDKDNKVGGDAEELDRPGEYVCGCKIVWWPAIIQRFEKENEGGRCLSVREVVCSMESELQGVVREKINEHLHEKGDLPVWQLRYEARDSMESETVPVFFINNESLMHLHNQWGQGTYKTATTITDQSELDDEPLFDGLTALDFAMSALQNSFQEKDDADDDDSAETIDDIHESVSPDAKKPLTAVESLVMHQFSGMLQRLTRTLSAREENSSVSAGDVWDFFSNLSEFDSSSSEQNSLKSFLRNPSAQNPPVLGSDSTEKAEDRSSVVNHRSLETDPFPRSCNNASSSASSSNNNASSSSSSSSSASPPPPDHS